MTEIRPVQADALSHRLEGLSPEEVIRFGSAVAGALADVIERRRLSITIQGRRYVRFEGWAALGAMLGVAAREARVVRREDGAYEAEVEIVRLRDQAVVGRGSAVCSPEEPNWAGRPEYAIRSMAVTRAAGKAFRLAYSWVMALAGYEPTPAEEAADGGPAAPPEADSFDWVEEAQSLVEAIRRAENIKDLSEVNLRINKLVIQHGKPPQEVAAVIKAAYDRRRKEIVEAAPIFEAAVRQGDWETVRADWVARFGAVKTPEELAAVRSEWEQAFANAAVPAQVRQAVLAAEAEARNRMERRRL